MTIILLISLALATNTIVTVEAKAYSFTATISPIEVNVNQLITFSVTINNTGESLLGSASISIPAGFTVSPSIPIVTPPSSWSSSLSAEAINLTADTGGATIKQGESLVFTFNATAPAYPNVTIWTANAKSGINWGGTLLDIDGAQPTVTVIVTSELVPPTISASPSKINQGQISLLSELTNALGGNSPYTYQWLSAFDGGAFSPIAGANGLSYTFSTTTSTATGTWSFQLSVTDSSSVPVTVTSDTVNVVVNAELAAPEVTATPSAITQNQASTLVSSPVTSGTSPYTYLWFQKAPGNDYTTVGSDSSIYIFPGSITIGTWAFLLQVTDITGASANSSSVDITVSSTTPVFTITVTQGTHGTINPGTTSVILGSTQSFTISPDVGYQIADVSVDGVSVGTVTSYTFTGVATNHNITADFAISSTKYFIDVVSSHGSPTPSTQVNAGGSFTASVTSPEGDTSHRWICTGYSIDAGPPVSGTTYTFANVQENHIITFNWQEQFHLSVISLEGATSGTGWCNGGTTATVSVPSNTITSDNGTRHIFTGWTGDATGTDTTSNPITVDSPKTATATWKTQYQVTFMQSGIASDASGVVVIILGKSTTYEQLPNDIWIDAGDSITFSYVATVESNEAGKQYTLASTNFTSPLTINEPTTIQGYYEPQTSSASFTLPTIVLTAILLSIPPSLTIPLLLKRRKDKKKITPIANQGGSISPSTVQLIERGSDSTIFIITAHVGYRVADVVVDKSIHLGPVRTYKFFKVTKNHTISAIFHKE